MGRKLAVLTAFLFLWAFGAVFSTSATASGSVDPTDLRVYVRMQPEAPNSADGTFWEGPDVKIKLELQTKDEKGNWGNQGDKGNLKIYFVWDDVNRIDRVEYREPFTPLQGEHWLFAYAQSENEKYVSEITKIFIRYNIWEEPMILQGEEVNVSGDFMRWGPASAAGYGEAKGEITPEAASTVKITPTPTPAASNAAAALSAIREFVGGRTNLWIMLLILGLILLAATKILFREKR